MGTFGSIKGRRVLDYLGYYYLLTKGSNPWRLFALPIQSLPIQKVSQERSLIVNFGKLNRRNIE
jgi:hypothetical protein